MTRITNAMQNREAAQIQTPANGAAKKSVSTMLNALLDSEGYSKRFDELLGRRAPQFISSIISTVNGLNARRDAVYAQLMAEVEKVGVRLVDFRKISRRDIVLQIVIKFGGFLEIFDASSKMKAFYLR